jgi:hypothetical protein
MNSQETDEFTDITLECEGALDTIEREEDKILASGSMLSRFGFTKKPYVYNEMNDFVKLIKNNNKYASLPVLMETRRFETINPKLYTPDILVKIRLLVKNIEKNPNTMSQGNLRFIKSLYKLLVKCAKNDKSMPSYEDICKTNVSSAAITEMIDSVGLKMLLDIKTPSGGGARKSRRHRNTKGKRRATKGKGKGKGKGKRATKKYKKVYSY